MKVINGGLKRLPRLLLGGKTLAVDQGVETASAFSSPPSWMGAVLMSFPSGLSSTRIDVSFPGAPSTGLDLVSGFLAVKQDLSDLSLSPNMGRCVVEPPPEKPGMVR
jgi:hypothetical protein